MGIISAKVMTAAEKAVRGARGRALGACQRRLLAETPRRTGRLAAGFIPTEDGVSVADEGAVLWSPDDVRVLAERYDLSTVVGIANEVPYAGEVMAADRNAEIIGRAVADGERAAGEQS